MPSTLFPTRKPHSRASYFRALVVMLECGCERKIQTPCLKIRRKTAIAELASYAECNNGHGRRPVIQILRVTRGKEVE